MLEDSGIPRGALPFKAGIASVDLYTSRLLRHVKAPLLRKRHSGIQLLMSLKTPLRYVADSSTPLVVSQPIEDPRGFATVPCIERLSCRSRNVVGPERPLNATVRSP